MSLLSEHPNTIEAREHRATAVMHAARTLFRDPDWLDPDGDLAVWSWLSRIPYMNKPHHRALFRAWLRSARVEGSTPVAALSTKEVAALARQMAQFAKGGAA